jgi:hypothetical protein
MGKLNIIANTSDLAEGSMQKYRVQDQEILLARIEENTMLSRTNAHILAETFPRAN